MGGSSSLTNNRPSSNVRSNASVSNLNNIIITNNSEDD